MKLSTDEIELLLEGLDARKAACMYQDTFVACDKLIARLEWAQKCLIASQKNTPKQLAARVRD